MVSKQGTITGISKRESAPRVTRESTMAKKEEGASAETTIFEFTPEPTPPKQTFQYSRAPQSKDGIDEKPLPSPKAVLDVTQKRLHEEEAKQAVFRSRGLRDETRVDPAVQTFETPEQKVDKLQGEVATLILMLEKSQAKDDSKEAADLLGCKPSEVRDELGLIGNRLQALSKDGPAMWRQGERTAEPGLTAVPGSLMHQLDTFATTAVMSAPATANGSAAGLSYELRYSPNVATVAESSKVAALEAAVVELEKQLGTPDPGATGVDLHSTVAELYKRVSLLDTAKIDSISQRVKTVMEDVQRYENELADSKDQDGVPATTDDPDLKGKVDVLYEYCHRWNKAAKALPQVVARLRSLQALHQQSASFTTRLQALEQQQEELLKLLETTNTAVRGLGEGLQENMAILTDNMKSLEAKVSRVLKT